MRRSTLVTSLALGGLLAVGGVLLAPSLAGENRSAPMDQRQWLSIPQVHAKLEAAGYRHIEKIERERGGYEARATDRNGERLKLYVNPQTGDIMDQRRQGQRYSRVGTADQRAGADCTKRRCRDDQPPKPVSAASAAR